MENAPILTYISLLLGLLPASIFCQSLPGLVRSGADQEVLAGVNILAATKSRTSGTYTNEYGYFQLSLPADSVTLAVSYVGFEPFIQTFYLNQDTTLQITLTVSTLPEVAIQASRSAARPSLGLVDLPIEKLKAVPMLFGEPDIVRPLALTPGVSTGTEGLANGLYVRGGSPEQNLILLDGAQVYNAFHLFGFLSIFNAQAIRQVKLYKGGFPSRIAGTILKLLYNGSCQSIGTLLPHSYMPLGNRFCSQPPSTAITSATS